jgi:RNA polymerase sigma-70 factor (ECF subfamily)
METSMATDEQLILEFQKGSREAFSELFLRYRELIYAFFRRRVKDAARAEELAQETFVAILRGGGRYEPRATFRTYLFGIAYKILANHRRKLDQNSDGAGLGFDFPSHSAPGKAEDGLWVREAIAKLDGNNREVLLLREYEELSYEEIASVLRVPVNTVRSRLFRARLALKEILVSVPGKSVRKENALDSSV